MIPKYIIEKAIEGGWWPFEKYDSSTVRCTGVYTEKNVVTLHSRTTWSDGVSDKDVQDLIFEEIALDPDFWMALGEKGEWFVHSHKPFQKHIVMLAHAQCFYSLILRKALPKEINDFWKTV